MDPAIEPMVDWKDRALKAEAAMQMSDNGYRTILAQSKSKSARIRELEAEVARLRHFVSCSASAQHIEEIETEVARLTSELDDMIELCGQKEAEVARLRAALAQIADAPMSNKEALVKHARAALAKGGGDEKPT